MEREKQKCPAANKHVEGWEWEVQNMDGDIFNVSGECMASHKDWQSPPTSSFHADRPSHPAAEEHSQENRENTMKACGELASE